MKNIRTYLKNKISVQGKARKGEKADHTLKYVSILNLFATPPWALRLFL
jgi:hypothetical protein